MVLVKCFWEKKPTHTNTLLPNECQRSQKSTALFFWVPFVLSSSSLFSKKATRKKKKRKIQKQKRKTHHQIIIIIIIIIIFAQKSFFFCSHSHSSFGASGGKRRDGGERSIFFSLRFKIDSRLELKQRGHQKWTRKI